LAIGRCTPIQILAFGSVNKRAILHAETQFEYSKLSGCRCRIATSGGSQRRRR